MIGLIILFVAGCSPKNEPAASSQAVNCFGDSTLLKIASLQHDRATAGLLGFLDSTHSQVHRLAAITALASVQDTMAVPQLLDLLRDPKMEVVVAAACALGQTGKGGGELLAAGLSARSEEDALLVLEACGKTGEAQHLDSLMARTAQLPMTDPHQAGVMAACFRFGVRGIVNKGSAGRAYALIPSGNPSARHWACAFVGRVGALGSEADTSALFGALAAPMPADDLQHLVKRLGKCPSSAARPRLEAYLADSRQDWRVRVSALRALRSLGDGSITSGLRSALQAPNPPLAMEAASYLLDHCGKVKADDGVALALAKEAQSPVLKASILAAAVKHSQGKPSADSVRQVVDNLLESSPDPTVKGLCYIALSYDKKEEAFLSKRLFEVPLGGESTAIMTGLMQLYAREPNATSARVNLVKQAVATNDIALVGMAAGLLRDPAAGLDKVVKDTTFLAEALLKLKMPRDIETAIEIRRTIHHINGTPDAALPPPPPAAGIDWILVSSIPSDQIWVLETSKGKVRIELDVEAAPSTVGNIVRLIREKYYDGKLFHRVVPNFVAQAGCPRGDGWGSVEPMIRSEWPGLRFEAGAVGMASAGKDTESCQFFITHSSTPHLDGRYTVFGYVKSGMEVVDQLNLGDVITRSYLE